MNYILGQSQLSLKECKSCQPATQRATNPKKPTTTTPVKQTKPAPPPTKKPSKRKLPQKVRKGKPAFQLVDEEDEAQQESIPQREDDDPDLNLAKKLSLEAHQEKGEEEEGVTIRVPVSRSISLTAMKWWKGKGRVLKNKFNQEILCVAWPESVMNQEYEKSPKEMSKAKRNKNEDAMDKEVADKCRFNKEKESDSAASGLAITSLRKNDDHISKSLDTREGGVDSSLQRSDPRIKTSEQSSDDIKENKLQRKTYDIGSFIKWFCRLRTGSSSSAKSLIRRTSFQPMCNERTKFAVQYPKLKALVTRLGPERLSSIVCGLRVNANMSISAGYLYMASLTGGLGGEEFYINKHIYNYLREIILRRADYQEYKISEKDFKNLHPNDFEDLFLLNIQEKLNHLPKTDKISLHSLVKCGISNFVILPEHPSETIVFHNEDGNPARANIKQALGYLKVEREIVKFPVPEKSSVKASANSDVLYFFTSAQDGDPSQDDVRLCLSDDLKNRSSKITGNGYSRKRAKRKPKASNSKHGVEEGKVKSHQNEENTT
ncbi:hypothetical protein Tco_0794500 [Tanacetum coccineum]